MVNPADGAAVEVAAEERVADVELGQSGNGVSVLIKLEGIPADAVKLGPNGLEVLRPLSMREYEAIVMALDAFMCRVREMVPYWIGDLWNYGKSRCPRYYKYPWMKAKAWVIGTVRNYGWTCKRLAAKLRGVLSWRHLFIVAMEPDPAKQEELVRRVRRERLTTRETYRLVRGMPVYRLTTRRARRVTVKEAVIRGFGAMSADHMGRWRQLLAENPEEALKDVWRTAVTEYAKRV